MKPAPFRYHRPASVADAIALLAELQDAAAVLAGGQSLVPMMNLRLAQPTHVVDVNAITELDHLSPAGDGLVMGALTRHAVLETAPEVGRRAPLMAQAAAHIAYPSIRNRGTLGGSLAHADPSAELGCVAVALGATVVLVSVGGERELSMADFLEGPFATSRRPDELLREVRVPGVAGRQVFRELSRKTGDFALVLVAVILELEEGVCRAARVALGGVGPVPFRSATAEQALAGRAPASGVLREAAALAAAEAQPTGDIHGSATYRRRVAEVEVRRALEEATA